MAKKYIYSNTGREGCVNNCMQMKEQHETSHKWYGDKYDQDIAYFGRNHCNCKNNEYYNVCENEEVEQHTGYNHYPSCNNNQSCNCSQPCNNPSCNCSQFCNNNQSCNCNPSCNCCKSCTCCIPCTCWPSFPPFPPQPITIPTSNNSHVGMIPTSRIGNGQQGINTRATLRAVDEDTVLLAGPTGIIPFNINFVVNGSDISGTDPILLTGPHTYLIEWSLSVNPTDADADAKVELLVDGNPVTGSQNYESLSVYTDGFVPISGGAIVNIASGVHTLQLRYITGQNGLEAKYANLRIVQLS